MTYKQTLLAPKLELRFDLRFLYPNNGDKGYLTIYIWHDPSCTYFGIQVHQITRGKQRKISIKGLEDVYLELNNDGVFVRQIITHTKSDKQ